MGFVNKITVSLFLKPTICQESEGPFPWFSTPECSSDSKPGVLGKKPLASAAEDPSNTSIQCSSVKSDSMVSDPNGSTKLSDLEAECSRLGCISFDLPPENATSGKVLWHAIKQFEKLHKKHRPMIFKFGYTHDAMWRWNNSLYGYKHEKAKWSHMKVLYVSKEPFGPSMLEAALISRFESDSAEIRFV